MHCPDCKKTIPEQTLICEFCGKALKEVPQEKTWLLILFAFLVFAVGTLLLFYRAPELNIGGPLAGRMNSDVTKSISGQTPPTP